jgi:hypothetical protein
LKVTSKVVMNTGIESGIYAPLWIAVDVNDLNVTIRCTSNDPIRYCSSTKLIKICSLISQRYKGFVSSF